MEEEERSTCESRQGVRYNVVEFFLHCERQRTWRVACVRRSTICSSGKAQAGSRMELEMEMVG